MRDVRQNLFFAFVSNSLGVPIAAGVPHPFFGLQLSPIIAAAAMALSSVSVIGNSLRLRSSRLWTEPRRVHALRSGSESQPNPPDAVGERRHYRAPAQFRFLLALRGDIL